jgi:acyl carrier protein
MNSEKLKQIIINHPHLMKITPSVLSKVFKRIPRQSVIYQYDLDYTKTYSEQGLDDLDIIEMVMYIERELNISIHDELTDTIFSIDSYPINFTLWHREERLGELGI